MAAPGPDGGMERLQGQVGGRRGDQGDHQFVQVPVGFFDPHHRVSVVTGRVPSPADDAGVRIAGVVAEGAEDGVDGRGVELVFAGDLGEAPGQVVAPARPLAVQSMPLLLYGSSRLR